MYALEKIKMINKVYKKLKRKNNKNISYKLQASAYMFLFFFLCSFFSFSQVTATIDSTSIQIGAQITYKIQVATDSTKLVVFPEGQTFTPLEMIESYAIDTVKNDDKFNLIKKYGLTQFDSGSYTIPKQKIIIGDNTIFTDSLNVEVKNVVIDTTKQGLYDVKPIFEVDKTGRSYWWIYLLLALLILAIAGVLLWWFIWRKKPLTEEEKIALLPPYDRAKIALEKLDNSDYLKHEEIKEYYSELTLIIRTYLDEKVYDKALESTTDELVNRLQILKKGNQIDLSNETIANIETIFRRADLVKFAKSAPDIALAELDRNTIGTEIEHVKEVLPEPTEEEKLLDQQYRKEQERIKKRKKIWLTIGLGLFVIVAIIVGFSAKYGFNYVKDTVIGHESKELLEGEWYTSEYGVPPIIITTPKILKRTPPPIPEELKQQVEMNMFVYGSLIDKFNIVVISTKIKNLGKNKIELKQLADQTVKMMEAQGVENIITKTEEFVTPKEVEGLKIYGSADFPSLTKDKLEKGNYSILVFNTENVVQQIMLTWRENDDYAEKIVKRILDSVELKKEEE